MSQLTNIAKQSTRLVPEITKQAACFSTSSACSQNVDAAVKPKSNFFVEFQKKWKSKSSFSEFSRHPFQEVEALRPWPNSVNPYTGEIGGPTGPEPTRYGDWERKGRVSDF